MAYIESAQEFVNFCRSLAEASGVFTGSVASWRTNVIKFQSHFEENKDKFEKVFVRFIKDHQEVIDVPILNEDESFNDTWTKIPPKATEEGGWSKKTKGAQGVLLCLNPDSPKLANVFLPISELYALCCKYYSQKVNFGRINHKVVPPVFMKKFYALLASVDPSCYNFGKNVEILEETIQTTLDESSDDDTSEDASGEQAPSVMDFSKMFSMEGMMNLLSKIDVAAITSQLAANPEALEKAKQFTGLDASTVTTLLSDAPTLVNAVKSMKDGGAETNVAQALLESESFHLLASKHPDKIEAMKTLLQPKTEKSGEKPVPAVTEGYTDDASDQE